MEEEMSTTDGRICFSGKELQVTGDVHVKGSHVKGELDSCKAMCLVTMEQVTLIRDSLSLKAGLPSAGESLQPPPK